MFRPLLLVVILATLGAFFRPWYVRQGFQGRVIIPLCLLSISISLYAYALYGACHGEVNFFVNAAGCTRTEPPSFNPDYQKMGHAR